jgi:hypothetical protein
MLGGRKGFSLGRKQKGNPKQLPLKGKGLSSLGEELPQGEND